MSRKLKFIIIVLIINSVYADPVFQAKVYRQGSNKTEFLFHHFNEVIEKDSLTILRHHYVLPDSTPAVLDEMTLKNGEFYATQSQLYEKGTAAYLLRNGKKLNITFESKDETKEKETDFPESLIAGPVFDRYVQDNWETLISEESVNFHLPAPEFLRTAKFKMSQVENSDYNREGVLVFKMEAASFFLRFFVDASYFVYDKETKLLREIHGLTILPTKQDGKFENTYVNMYYTYPGLDAS